MKFPLSSFSHWLHCGSSVLVALSLTACNFEPDSGKWSGVATFRDGVRPVFHCSLEVDVTHSEDYVSLNNSSTDCGSRATRWMAGSFELRGSELRRGSQVFGQVYTDGTVRLELDDPYLTFHYPYPAQKVIISWVRTREDLQYTEWAFFDGRIQTIEARLHRAK